MTIRQVRNILAVQMYLSIATAAVIAVLFETETLIPGAIEKGSTLEFILLTAMEIVTICAIPAALRLFRFGFVRRAIEASPERGLLKWGVVRLDLLCGTMTANTLFYYLTPLDVAFAYMAIICLISLVFVNPTMKRCLYEAGM